MLKKKPETAAQGEQIQQVPVQNSTHSRPSFQVLDDEAMPENGGEHGPVRRIESADCPPRAEGGYEIISGHRRQHAARLAGMKTLPVIVRQLDDDQAILQMVESNLQRETIRPASGPLPIR